MKTTVIVLVILAAVIIGGVWRMGFFQKIDFAQNEIGPLNAVYLEHKGPYQQAASKINDVAKYLDENKISHSESFGEYFDNPQEVKAENLRSNCGFIVDKLPKVKPPFMSKRFAKKAYVTAFFTGSPAIGPMVVYPRAMKWLSANGYKMSGPAIELYKMADKKITIEYLFEVSSAASEKGEPVK